MSPDDGGEKPKRFSEHNSRFCPSDQVVRCEPARNDSFFLDLFRANQNELLLHFEKVQH